NGAGDLTVSGPFNWTGGTMSGTGKTVVPNTLNPSGSPLVLQHELDGQGTASWTAGDLQMANGVFVNTGTFTANSSGTLQSYGVTSGSTNTFTNSGSFIKQGTGTAQFIASTTGVTFVSTGPVDLQAGSLRLAAGGSSSGSSGTLTVASGTTLDFASNFTLHPRTSQPQPDGARERQLHQRNDNHRRQLQRYRHHQRHWRHGRRLRRGEQCGNYADPHRRHR